MHLLVEKHPLDLKSFDFCLIWNLCLTWESHFDFGLICVFGLERLTNTVFIRLYFLEEKFKMKNVVYQHSVF